MLKAYVDTPPHLSQAMHRVTRALKRYAPDSVQIVNTPQQADLQVFHVVGNDVLRHRHETERYAIVQYHCKTAGGNLDDWGRCWNGAAAVWSYYDLRKHYPEIKNFYYAPLGLDPAFVNARTYVQRTGVMTSGYVHGDLAEAIQEPAFASDRCGMPTVHLGPKPVGMTIYPRQWESINSIPDEVLAAFYSRVQWVSGLRHIEGFELPVIEGLACGARPVVFDRAETRHWFNGHAVFVPECSGSELIDRLTAIFTGGPDPVSEQERHAVLQKFNWETIIGGFWSAMGQV